jgi:hypothetical protein
MDDHKYSVGRTVVFKLSGTQHTSGTGRWTGKASGTILSVSLDAGLPQQWVYTIERQRSKESHNIFEEDVLYGVTGKRKSGKSPIGEQGVASGEALADILDRMVSESALANFLRTTVRDLVRREESEEAARREGRDLPLKEGDYIRVRGDLRHELEQFHNYYGKIIDVFDADIAALEAKPARGGDPRVYKVVKKYRVFLDDGHLVEIYDPEIKIYYTTDGRKTILNWRAAAFLAEAFGDSPPYRVEFSYLEDHVFSREELASVNTDDLSELLASILYVKGHMGWRDFEERQKRSAGLPIPYLIDSILAASRFDQRKNRPMTQTEIEERRRQTQAFKELLGR